MSSRESILSALRRAQPPATTLPDLSGPWITYADRPAQFTLALESVGGRAELAADAADVQRRLSELPAYAEAKTIVSRVADVGRSTLDIEALADPHLLETIDFAVLPGRFGVCENAAVWVDDADLKHRVAYFIPQHLALVVPRDQLVDNMHAAYERLSFDQPRFGTFISGPSKTADIEQSLVIGAHGPRSLTVFLVGA